MLRLLVLTCIFLALSSVHTQSCSDATNLRTLYGFANTVTTPAAASGVNYCKSIKSSPVCCTASDINSIPTKSDKTIASLTSMVAARDTYLKTVRDTVIPDLINTFQTLLPVIAEYRAYIAQNTPSGAASGIDASTLTDGIHDIATYLIANISQIKANYGSYQKARTSCVVEMANLQNAAYCLSCDPNAASKGYFYTNGMNGINLSPNVCNRLKSQCRGYIDDSIGQNAVIGASYTSSYVGLLASALKGLMVDDVTVFNQMQTAAMNAAAPSSNSVTAADTPDGCDGGSCDWICNNLFVNGEINQLALVLGGEFAGRRRLTEKTSNNNNRVLQGGTWNPDSDESGVAVTFQDDPSSTPTNAKSGMILDNVVMGVMAVASAILLF